MKGREKSLFRLRRAPFAALDKVQELRAALLPQPARALLLSQRGRQVRVRLAHVQQQGGEGHLVRVGVRVGVWVRFRARVRAWVRARVRARVGLG